MQNPKPEKPLVILTGPTGVGKTKLSINLAKRINGEIISADSVQVYKYMDIGSAKIKPDEMDSVKHHLIDVLMPEDNFDVFTFQKMAKKAIADIYAKGKIPILVGGTGFYIQAVLYDIDFSMNDETSDIRKELEDYALTNGNHSLHEMLNEIDPESAKLIHENNVKRVIRAIEFYKLTGVKISSHNKEQQEKESPYNFAYFVLSDERENLYKNIDLRVDEMIKEGLVEEVRSLLNRGVPLNSTAMQGLGYKEMAQYIRGEISFEEAVYIIKRDTRHFAKRQLTWFRREKDVITISKNEYNYDTEKMLLDMLKILSNKHIY